MADQELVITLRWAAEAAEQMANQYFQRRLRNIQEVAEAEQVANDQAAKNLRSRVRDAAEIETRAQKEITQIREQAANAGHAIARQETNDRIRELDRLRGAIQARYTHEATLHRQAAAANLSIGRQETNDRIRELDRLQAAIRARFAGRDRIGMMMGSAQEDFRGTLAARIKARRQIQQEEFASQQKFDKDWEQLEASTTRAVAAIDDRFHQERAEAAQSAAKERAFVEDREAREHIERQQNSAKRVAEFDADLEKQKAAARKQGAKQVADAVAGARQEGAQRASDFEASLDERDRARAKRSAELDRQFAGMRSDARKEGAQRASDFERALDEKDARLDASIAAKRKRQVSDEAQGRIEQSTRLAQKQVDIAAGATEEMTRAQKVYNRAQKAGDKEGMESSRQYFQRRSQDAKEAIEKATRYTKDAEREMGTALKNRTAEEQVMIRRANTERIDGVKRTTRAAREGYNEVARSAGRSMTEVSRSTRNATQAMKEHGDSVYTVGQLYFAMHAFSEFGSALERVWTAVGESTKETEDYIHKMVDDTKALRDSMAEIIAMTGKQANFATVAGEMAKAEAAFVTPKQYNQFQESYRSSTNQYLAPAGTPAAEQANYRLTPELAEQLSKDAMTTTAALGIEQKAGADLLSLVIKKARVAEKDELDKEGNVVTPKGKVVKKDVRGKYAKLLRGLQDQEGRTSPLIPQFAEFVNESVGEGADFADILDAAIFFQSASQINPKHASAYARAVTRGLRQILSDKKEQAETGQTRMEELGLKQGMTTDQMLSRAATAIPEMAKKLNITESQAVSRYFDEIREFAGFQSYIHQGVEGKLFDRARARMAATGIDFTEGVQKEYAESARGRGAQQEAREAKIKGRQGAKYEDFDVYKKKVANDIREAGELEEYRTTWNAILDQAGKGKTFESEEDLFVYQDTGRMILEGLGHYMDDDDVSEFMAKNAGLLQMSAAHPFKNEKLQAEGYDLWVKAQRRRGARGINPSVKAGSIYRKARELAARDVDAMEKAMGGSIGGMAGRELAGSRERAIAVGMTDILRKQLGGNAPAQGRMSDEQYNRHLAAAIADPNVRAMMEAGSSPEARARAERVQAGKPTGLHSVPPTEAAMSPAEAIRAHMRNPGRFPMPSALPGTPDYLRAHLRSPGRFPLATNADMAAHADSPAGRDFARNVREFDFKTGMATRWHVKDDVPSIYRDAPDHAPGRVRPNVASLHRADPRVGDDGMFKAARELHHAVRAMKRHLPSALPARPHVHR